MHPGQGAPSLHGPTYLPTNCRAQNEFRVVRAAMSRAPRNHLTIFLLSQVLLEKWQNVNLFAHIFDRRQAIRCAAAAMRAHIEKKSPVSRQLELFGHTVVEFEITGDKESLIENADLVEDPPADHNT